MATISILTLLLLLLVLATTAKPQHFSRRISHSSLNIKREKLSHLHFYFHDKVSGRNPTAIPIASSPLTNHSSTGFGLTVIVDDQLTIGPDPNSRIVGRAQGIYASAAMDEVGLLMVMNLAFVEGKYNGSSLSVMGRNRVFDGLREMPVVGGSGLFRLARGYVTARTKMLDLRTGDAVVEYDAFVFHY